MTSAKIIVLMVSIIMPQDVPDINHLQKMKSFDECWAAAKEFTERDLSNELRDQGALGLKAMCGYQEFPTRSE